MPYVITLNESRAAAAGEPTRVWIKDTLFPGDTFTGKRSRAFEYHDREQAEYIASCWPAEHAPRVEKV